MKKLTSIFSAILVSVAAFAQNAQIVTADFAKGVSATAIQANIASKAEDISAVLEAKFKEGTGNKAKSSKGMTSFEASVFKPISEASFDYFYKVEKASKKEDAGSTVTLYISAGNNNFLTQDKYSGELKNAQEFLNSLVKEVRIYELTNAIKEQSKVVEKSMDEQKKLESSQKSLEKERDEIMKKLEDNKSAQDNQKKTIETEKGKLDQLEADLKAVK